MSDIPGDIAYSYLDGITSTAAVKTFLDGGADSVQLWIGVSRAPWLWVTGRVLMFMCYFVFIPSDTENDMFMFMIQYLSVNTYTSPLVW